MLENKERNVKRIVKKTLCGMLCASMLLGGGYALGKQNAGKVQGNEESIALEQYDVGSGVFTDEATELSIPEVIQTANTTSGGKQVYTPAQIAEKYLSTVVSISAKSTKEVYDFFGGVRQYESEGAGSGIVVAKTDEEVIIATNNHVIEGAKELSVCFNDNEEQIYPARVKGTDPSNDLAVVSVKLSDIPKKVRNTLMVATIGDSDKCVMGEQVVAIGNALGYGQSLTSGYISALNREVTVDNVTYTLIQTDAAINPGNSGGALFNMYGEVIGINSVKFASESVEGMGFAIPISKAYPILNELAERQTREIVAEEKQGYLGIGGTDVTAAAGQYYGMPIGVYVSQLEENGAAKKAGMHKGDIITAFDGVTISTINQLKENLQYYAAGEKVEVTVKRIQNGQYEEKVLTVTLSKKPVTE